MYCIYIYKDGELWKGEQKKKENAFIPSAGSNIITKLSLKKCNFGAFWCPVFSWKSEEGWTFSPLYLKHLLLGFTFHI